LSYNWSVIEWKEIIENCVQLIVINSQEITLCIVNPAYVKATYSCFLFPKFTIDHGWQRNTLVSLKKNRARRIKKKESVGLIQLCIKNFLERGSREPAVHMEAKKVFCVVHGAAMVPFLPFKGH